MDTNKLLIPSDDKLNEWVQDIRRVISTPTEYDYQCEFCGGYGALRELIVHDKKCSGIEMINYFEALRKRIYAY